MNPLAPLQALCLALGLAPRPGHGWMRAAARLLLAIALWGSTAAQAVIVFNGVTYGRNGALPTDGSPGALTIARPAGIGPGQALVASIAARPRSMTAVPPPGWVQMTFSNQTNGGTSTAPGGMTLVTYFKIVGLNEPASYTWTFANPANGGGSAVGGIMAFSGIDTAGGNPIDHGGTAWSEWISTSSSLTHITNPITTVTPNTMVISSISYQSASSFADATGIAGLVERLDQSAPATPNAVGQTLQMSTAPFAGPGNPGTAQAVAAADTDYGIGHLMALRPSGIDPSLTMARNAALSPGGAASYTFVVKNLGFENEPGPLTVVNTLPSGLSLSSATGSGWACSASGQTVTCSRPGSLAAGDTAPTLTVNVAVSPSASGTLTSSASVSGTGGDGNMDNNVAADTYVFLATPHAYYPLDETSWGTVSDASGNARHASAVGGAYPTGPSAAAPFSAALTGNPGTCGAGVVPAGTGAIGINTGIAPSSLGNAGSIAFWYAGATAWNDGTARMLFDASNTPALGGQHFFLTKTGAGILSFSVRNAAGNVATASTVSYGYLAREWHHITVTWNISGSALAIYIDGILAGSSSTTLGSALGSTATLYLGAQRMSGVTGAAAGYTANSANGWVDELRLYASDLGRAAVEAVVTETHPCSYAIDHYELSMASNGISCLANTVTVVACANTSSPCTSPANTVGGNTVTLSTSPGTLAATTLTLNASGSASTTLSHALATSGATAVVTLSGEQAVALNPRKCCSNGSSCIVANACATAYDTAGFAIAASAGGAATTLPTLTAASASANLWLRAVKTNTSTQACEAALTGATTVDWAMQCHDPGTCSAGNRLSLAGNGAATAVAANPASAVSARTAVGMTFDANGNAPFSFRYADAGRISLQASKAAGGTLMAALSVTSPAFVVKPAALQVSAIRCASYAPGSCATTAIASPGNNPAAASAAGAAFMPAGKPFAATVTAVDADGNATPNFGQESTPATVSLASSLVLPAGGVNPALQNASGFGAFSGGAASGNGFVFSEVGILQLTPQLTGANYLGTGNIAGTPSANVGRFIAHHFDVAVTPACSGSFSYAGQPFDVTVTARNGLASPTTTQNHSGASGFARTLTFSEATALGVGSLGGASVAASAFVAGLATATPSYAYTAKETGPRSLVLRAVDSDGVSSAGFAEGSTALRSGRLRLANAFGSAGAPLQLAVAADYWGGSSWVPNSADSCTSLPAASVVLSNPRNALGAASTASSSPSAITLAAGQGLLSLAAPSPAGSSVSFDLALNLGSSAADQSCQAVHPASTGANLPWLRSRHGSCASAWDRDPAARASFGIFAPETRRTVHVRELF